jgi:hypothetical protein
VVVTASVVSSVAAALVRLDVLVADGLAAQVCLNNTHPAILPPRICAAPLPPSPLQICTITPFPVTPPLQICSPLHFPTLSSPRFCFAPPFSSHQQIQFNKVSLHQALARRLCHHLGLQAYVSMLVIYCKHTLYNTINQA